MSFAGWVQIALAGLIVVALTRPLGGCMIRLVAGERVFLAPFLGPLERGLYRLAGIDERQEQRWPAYALAMLAFNAAGVFALYALQHLLPLDPQGFDPLPPDLAFNTGVSFVTNTNWQSCAGESTMGHLVQMAGLTVQNFVSAATGIALALALIRGFTRTAAGTIGDFWADLVRGTLYLLLPVSVVPALFLVWQGVPRNLDPYTVVTTLEGARQTIAQGPVASQAAIKMLGTNGGGFFNANSAHPCENPTALSNLVQMVAIFAIGAALTDVLGRMAGDERQGWAVLAAMGVLFMIGVLVAYRAEAGGNPALTALGLDPAAGNMEGKEVRFGIAASALFAVITTAASCGAVNAMHDSFTALGSMIPLINMELGEIIVGGVGAGLYGMLLFVTVAMFVAGLMVARTPEYLGKKLAARLAAGFEHGGKRVQLDDRSQGLLSAATLAADQGKRAGRAWPASFRWRTADNGWLALPAADDMVALGVAAFLTVQALRAVYWGHKDALRAAATVGDLERYDLAAGWPA